MNWFEFEITAFLWIFIILNVVNVVLQTVKSIATVKCGAWSAAVVNAIAFALYTVVVVYMNADGLGLFWKAVIIGLANLFGVYAVKVIEIKNQKDKLWEIRATVKGTDTKALHEALDHCEIPHNFIKEVGKYTIFNCYCATQKESMALKGLLDTFNAKYFVSESKTL
jgi:hypothetical protein